MTLGLLATCNLSCTPVIHPVDPAAVARTERRARPVELCLLMQERDVRPRWQGVAELSFEPWQYAIASVLIRHPTAGLVVVDPAFGSSVANDLARAGPVFTLFLGDARTKRPLVDVLREAKVDPDDVRYALVTHAHWDHAGALGDLVNAKVLMSRAELDWTQPFDRYVDHGVVTTFLRRAKSRLFAFPFNGPAVDGFEASFDVFGDGSIVAVPLPGHTPGSTAYFVRGAEKTYLFVGDASWTVRGVEKPAFKTLTAFDSDLSVLAGSLGTLNAFFTSRPDVLVVPAHDAAALEQLPMCKDVDWAP